jgi:hypothetical protein
MTVHPRLASTLLVGAALLWCAAPDVTAAQDVMELDLAFKNGRLGTHTSEVQQERRDSRANSVVATTKKRSWRRRPGNSR